MLAAVVAAIVVPWLTPLTFSSHPSGWYTGASGTYFLTVGSSHQRYPVSVAWTANVICPDCNHFNPPNGTLRHLGPNDVVVWASIQEADPTGWPPAGRRLSPRLSLGHAFRLPCCDGTSVAGGAYELYAFGPRKAYTVLVRVYWGSPPMASIRTAAQHAISALVLPAARR